MVEQTVADALQKALCTQCRMHQLDISHCHKALMPKTVVVTCTDSSASAVMQHGTQSKAVMADGCSAMHMSHHRTVVLPLTTLTKP